MGKKTNLVRMIAEFGCGGVLCGECPFSPDGGVCEAYNGDGLMENSPEIKAQAQAWLAKTPSRA